MHGKNVINTIFAVVAVIFGTAIFYFTNIYLVLVLLPALALYCDAINGKYYATAALLVCFSLIAFALDLTGMIILFIVAITAAASLVSLKKGSQFFDGLGYAMAASVIAAMAGIFAVYLANGRQNLMTIASQSIANWVGQLPQEYSSIIVISLTWITSNTPDMNSYNEIVNMMSNITGSEQAQLLIPRLSEFLALWLPAASMTSSMLYGGIIWYSANLLIARSVRKGRKAEGVTEFNAPPEFSNWRMPRWLVTTVAVLLLAVFLAEISGSQMLVGAAIVVQSVVMAAITVQGLSLVRWFLKRWNIPEWGAWIFMAIAVLLSSIVMWVGFIDIIFNIRAFTESKKNIRNAMDQMRQKIEDEMKRQQQGKDEPDNDENKDPRDDDEDSKRE